MFVRFVAFSPEIRGVIQMIQSLRSELVDGRIWKMLRQTNEVVQDRSGITIFKMQKCVHTQMERCLRMIARSSEVAITDLKKAKRDPIHANAIRLASNPRIEARQIEISAS